MVLPTLAQQILEAVRKQRGITDRRLAEVLFGLGAPQQRVNVECRRIAAQGLLTRASRPDGLIGNYEPGKNAEPPRAAPASTPLRAGPFLSEDRLKILLKAWLEAEGWLVEVAWAKLRGIDIHARRGVERWIIEAKGGGSLDAMRVNYFLAVLGETLQRMDDPRAAYSIALPDVKQFRNLWSRLPSLAKQRTSITALFVREDGRIERL
jgi:hypothetical protein